MKTKILKGGRQAGSTGACLKKKGGLETSFELSVNPGVRQGSILCSTLLYGYCGLLQEKACGFNSTSATDVKMDGSVLEKNLFKMQRLTFSSKLDWASYIILFAKTVSEKIGALICFMKFLSPEAVLYIYKSTLRPRMESCCHFWAVVPSCYLVMLNKLQNCLSRTEGPLLAGCLQPLLHRRILASFS